MIAYNDFRHACFSNTPLDSTGALPANILQIGTPPMPGKLLNPSVIVREDQIWTAIRLLRDDGQSETVWGRLDPSKLDPNKLTAPTANSRIVQDLTASHRNYEDWRPFFWRGQLRAVCSVTNRPYESERQGPQIALLDLDAEANIQAAHVYQTQYHEKNWMPLVTDNTERLRLVYRTEPLVVLDYPNAPAQVDRKSAIRGGSQLVPFRDGWLAVVHEVEGRYRHYIHRLVHFDQAVTHAKLGKPWRFRPGNPIEFCAGLAWYKPLDRFVLSFGTNDREAHIALVKEDTIADLIL